MTRMDRRISMIPNLLAAMVLVAVTAPGLADDLTNDLKIEQQGSFQIGGSQRTVNGQPGLVIEFEGVTETVLAFDIAEDRITNIWAVRNPEKLRPWTS